MNSITYFGGLFGLTSMLIFGSTVYKYGWKNLRFDNVGLYNEPYVVLYGMMGASLCGLGTCLINDKK